MEWEVKQEAEDGSVREDLPPDSAVDLVITEQGKDQRRKVRKTLTEARRVFVWHASRVREAV